MPRTKEANQQIYLEQRVRIVEAARRVFARKGLSATIDDVAAEARISHGLAYRYFANKAALFSELVIQDLQTPTDWLEAFDSQPAAPIEKIRRMVSGFVNSRREYPEHYQLLAQVLNDESAPQDLRQKVTERGQAVQAVLRDLIIAGQASGEVAAGDPDQLARAVFAALDGLTARPVTNRAAYLADFPSAEIFLRMLQP